MTFKKLKYSSWYIVTRELYSLKSNFCEKYSADKIKNQKKTRIISHQYFPITFIIQSNALSLPQTKNQINKILANAKIHDLGKVSREIANDMRIKSFLKNKNRKKYKRDRMLTFIFYIYNYLIIIRKSCDKYILRNVSWYLYLYFILWNRYKNWRKIV